MNNMSSHPANTDSLRALDAKICAHSESQDRVLENEIEIITNGRIASGGFQSGNTIRDVVRVCGTLLENRAGVTLSTIKELPFSYAADLEPSLREHVQRHFSEDLGGFQVQVRNLARKALGNKVEDTALDEIRKAQNRTLKNLLAEVDQYLVNLKHRSQISTAGKRILLIEVGCLVGTAFLAGLWVADKNGNYEPFIVLLAVIASALEIVRRTKYSYAT